MNEQHVQVLNCKKERLKELQDMLDQYVAGSKEENYDSSDNDDTAKHDTKSSKNMEATEDKAEGTDSNKDTDSEVSLYAPKP